MRGEGEGESESESEGTGTGEGEGDATPQEGHGGLSFACRDKGVDEVDVVEHVHAACRLKAEDDALHVRVRVRVQVRVRAKLRARRGPWAPS